MSRLSLGAPLDLGPRSSDEYDPPPATPVVEEAARRSRRAMEDLVRRGAVSRRELLRSAAASASVLSALSAARRARPARSVPSSATFSVPASSSTSVTSTTTTLDPAAASSVLDNDEFVMDVQLHFLDPTATPVASGGGFPKRTAAPTPACASPRTCSWTWCSVRATPASASFPLAPRGTRIACSPSTSWSGPRSWPSSVPISGSCSRRRCSRPAGCSRPRRRHGRRRRHLPGGGLEDLHARPRPVPARRRARRRAADPGRSAGRPILAVHKGLAGESTAASRPTWVRPRRPIPTGRSSCTTRASRWPLPRVRSRPTCPPSSCAASTASWPASGRRASGPAGTSTRSWEHLVQPQPDLDSAGHVLGKLLTHLGPERIL